MTLLTLPERLNAAEVFVDSHLDQGREGKAAILCGDETVTYGRLHENVNRMGNVFKGLGVRIEERVAILMPDCPEWVYAFYGSMKIGAVAVPMNTMLTAPDYEYLLNDCRARVLVVHASLKPKVDQVRQNLRFLEHVLVAGDEPSGPDNLGAALGACSPKLSATPTNKDDMAFWLYSSGTTGFPKGAIHLHHDMIVEADLYARNTIGLREDDVSFSVAKLFFAYGLGNGLYFPLRLGATTVLLPDRPTPERAFQVLERYEPTVYYGVPTSYAAMLHLAERSGRTSLGRVRMCVSAGEPLPSHLFEKWEEQFGVEILDGIGSTEILHIFISNRPGKARAGSTGQIVEGYEARILDEHGQEVPPRTVGTLMIKGDSIAAGYWNKHEQTKETFCGQWINTHDKFLVDEDGFFWYAGRTDDMMKVSGQAVWPTDVEAVLLKHPAVLESGVVGLADQDGLIKPCAFVVLKDKQTGTPELARQLQAFVKQTTSPHKYPRAVVFVDELPKTATGKIQRYKLRQLASETMPFES
ncbi:MAG: benzoate-CoA ligase family protein [Thermoguttaceae bacterium]